MNTDDGTGICISCLPRFLKTIVIQAIECGGVGFATLVSWSRFHGNILKRGSLY